MNLRILCAIMMAAIPATRLLAAPPARPNILYLYVDDMGWGSIGPNGQAARRAKGLPTVQTPHLDRLAAEGLNFTRGYGCHVCSPARSSQQSGFHQGHTFADRNDPNNAKKAMRADDRLMGDVLAAAGYTTGYWGKWGYGGSKDLQQPVIDNVQTLPTSHGYQHVLAELHHVRAHTFFQPTLWSAPAAKDAVGGLQLVPNSMSRYQNNDDYPQAPALQDHADYPQTAYCDDAYAFAALDFIRLQGQNYNQTGQPFFGLLAVQIPHAPFGEITQLPDWDAEYKDNPQFAKLADQTRQWAAMVTRIDAHFGNLFAALDDPNNDGDNSDSIAANTLVIFQSDNGGPGGKNNVELDANGGLTGNKGRIQEGGIRVPLVMRWPAKITAESELKAGTNCDRVVDVTDLLPTFCDLAGAEIPLGVDGVSLAPTLLGEGHQRVREFIIHEAGNGQSIIRGKHKLVRSKNRAFQLYDLDADPAETTNLAMDNKELVNELKELLLGERVAEPRGFANTYHHWTGEDGAAASDADNWSDYQYANAGIVYMEDQGPPQLSWIARIENSTDAALTARGDMDLQFLGLEIRGNKQGTQALVLAPKVNLTGRNEIRLSAHSQLVLDRGTVTSLRWIDVSQHATVKGSGTLDAIVYNAGTLTATGELKLNADLHQAQQAVLKLTPALESPVVNVAGVANLAGQLQLQLADDFKLATGASLPVLSANKIEGRFGNAQDEVITADGRRFAIEYSETTVTLVGK